LALTNAAAAPLGLKVSLEKEVRGWVWKDAEREPEAEEDEGLGRGGAV